MTAYGESGRQVVGAVDAPYTTEIIRSMALSSAELWHDVLQRLAEVQEGQILIAQAVAQLGAVVADLSAKVDLPAELAALASQGQAALGAPVQGALGPAVGDEVALPPSPLSSDQEPAEVSRRRFFRHGKATVAAEDDPVIDEAHLVSGEPIAEETVSDEDTVDEAVEDLVPVADEADVTVDDESPVEVGSEPDDESEPSAVAEPISDAVDVATEPRRHRFHLRRHHESVDETPADGAPVADEMVVADELGNADEAVAVEEAPVLDEVDEAEPAREVWTPPEIDDMPAEPKRGHFHLRRHRAATVQEPAQKPPKEPKEKRAKGRRAKRAAELAADDLMTSPMAEPEVAEAPDLDSVPLPPPPLVTPPAPVPSVTPPPPVPAPVVSETSVPLFADPADRDGRLSVVAQLTQLDDAAHAAPESPVLVADPAAPDSDDVDAAPTAPVESAGPPLPQALVYTPATAETARTEPTAITLDPIVEHAEPVALTPEPVALTPEMPEHVETAVEAASDAGAMSEEPVLAGVGAAVQSSASLATEILSSAPAPSEVGTAAEDPGPLVISPDVTLISKSRKRRGPFRVR